MAVTSTSHHDLRPRAGTARYWRTVIALVAAAVANFAQLWSVQPVLPAIAADLDTSAAQAALTVSLATGGMAVLISEESKVIDKLDGLLTLKGLRLIYERNHGEGRDGK